MSDRINQIEEQAKVILEWCRQRKGLPEEQWDILECREIIFRESFGSLVTVVRTFHW